MNVKARGNELERLLITVDNAQKCRIGLVSGKGHCRYAAPSINNGDRQTAADTKLRRLIE
jgi:hypothetical protein